jgi:hypothetical protein
MWKVIFNGKSRMPRTVTNSITECVKSDDLAKFKETIEQFNQYDRQETIINALHRIAYEGASNILGYVLTYQNILECIDDNPSIQESIFSAAAHEGHINIINQLLQIPSMKDYVEKNPAKSLYAAAGGRNYFVNHRGGHSDKVLTRLLEIPAVYNLVNEEDKHGNKHGDEYSKKAYFQAHSSYNDSTLKVLFLRFPKIFTYADEFDKKNSADLQMTRFFDNYFEDLNTRMTNHRKNQPYTGFKLDPNEAQLCFFILKYLLRTFPDTRNKKESSHPKLNIFFSKKISDKEIYMDRIFKLLSISAVIKIVTSSSELLMMALDPKIDNKIVDRLRYITPKSTYQPRLTAG